MKLITIREVLFHRDENGEILARLRPHSQPVKAHSPDIYSVNAYFGKPTRDKTVRELALEAWKAGTAQAQIARNYSISRQLVSKWVKYAAANPQKQIPRLGRPKQKRIEQEDVVGQNLASGSSDIQSSAQSQWFDDDVWTQNSFDPYHSNTDPSLRYQIASGVRTIAPQIRRLSRRGTQFSNGKALKVLVMLDCVVIVWVYWPIVKSPVSKKLECALKIGQRVDYKPRWGACSQVWSFAVLHGQSIYFGIRSIPGTTVAEFFRRPYRRGQPYFDYHVINTSVIHAGSFRRLLEFGSDALEEKVGYDYIRALYGVDPALLHW